MPQMFQSGVASAADVCVADPMAVATRPPAPTMRTGSLPATQVARLDAAARMSFKAAATPGAIVGVRAPAGTWTAAYGQADPAAGTPMAVGLHTRIGSITKTYVATVILQLAEAGKLSLDDPIAKYVARVPNGEQISLRMLANMTSGVASYTVSPKWLEIYDSRPDTIFTPDQILAYGLSDSPVFAPGTRYDYSNTNYVLLGFVIEKVTGQPIGDVLLANVLKPLKLAGTSWPGRSSAMPEPFAHGYTLQGKIRPSRPVDATNWNPAWGWTAGEMISTMDDLLVYGRAMGTGQGLLGPDTQVARLTSFDGPSGFYGIGIICKAGWVGHTGELAGYNTALFYDTRTDTTVAVQTNSDIRSGKCGDERTLADDPHDEACSSPALRIFNELAIALDRPIARSK